MEGVLCAVTWEVLDDAHYDVRSPEHRATVQVQGPGTTCAAHYGGTMEVGESASGTALGFSSVTGSSFGSLAPTTFSVAGVTDPYTIGGLAYGQGQLHVLLDSRPTRAFGVKVGTTRVTGFSCGRSSGLWQYSAPMVEPVWVANLDVAVELFPVTGVDPPPCSVNQGSGLFAQEAEAPEPLSVRRRGEAVFHDGASPFTLRFEFSEAVATGARAMRDRVFSVSDGEVTAAAPVEGRRDLWDITIRPASRADVLVLLPATQSCGAPRAVCTPGGNALRDGLAISVPRAPLTVEAETVPSGHNGRAVALRLAFSEPIATGYAALRDEALSATGGTVSEAKRVDGRSDLWRVTVVPAGDGEVTLSLPATTGACGDTGSVCTPDGNPLADGLQVRVPRAALTARFEAVPPSHDGETPFGLGGDRLAGQHAAALVAARRRGRRSNPRPRSAAFRRAR